ncbi:hypothetical protein BDY19DRAFT_989988 [Irpex rosettiformis]|uniref:Uncharacterized protein n=1 Tax=Irpex rosettiformis TaxID=378272 RepID=A0ACB8UGP5_9APHY|nr:hypothetical protein BDY19DRAFT_989988 [Irpex rosettiformis]
MSMEPHVSTTLHRTRSANSEHPVISKESDFDEDLENNTPTAQDSVFAVFLSSGLSAIDLYILRQRLARLRWLLVFYCAFSAVFLMSSVFSRLSQGNALADNYFQTDHRIRHESPLQVLPNTHLMSKLSPLYPPPTLLEPLVFRATTSNYPVTACLWTSDDGIDFLPSWASRWKGAISLLVTTYHEPSSLAYESLYRKLRTLHNLSSIKHKVSVHILHLAADTTENSNVFMNTARLFAQTEKVALFSGNLSVVPPKAFYRSVVSAVDSPKPVIFTMRQRTTYPFTPLSPVLISRDNSVWCTERFFLATPRSMEWAECLWQLWLDNYGDVEVKPTSDWIQESKATANTSDIEVKLHRRLGLKYRSETCVLATRQLAALRSSDRNADAIKSRWLKATCREWANGREN